MNLNNLTLTKLLLLSTAVYISWSGLCCDWLRSLQKSLELRFLGHDERNYETSFLRRHQDDPQVINDASSIPDGIAFNRTISYLSSADSLKLHFDPKYCKETDVYGENDCHYNWGERVALNYAVFANESLDENAYIEGSFKVNKLVLTEDSFVSLSLNVILTNNLISQVAMLPWHFTCAVCGQDCKAKAPIVILDFDIPMPPCPIDPIVYADNVAFQLPDLSPTEGLVAVPLQGEVVLYSKAQEVLVSVSIHSTVK